MTSLAQIQRYLRSLEIRLRLFAAARGFAIVAGTACALTVLLVWIANRFQFAGNAVLPLRIILFAAVATVLSLALAIPLFRINKRWVTRLAEHRIGDLKQRLLTVSEQPDPTNPFTELLAEEALRIIRSQPGREFAARGWMPALVACAVVGIGVLVWMITAGSGYWGYGASLLWTGKALSGARPLYEIVVQPGNKVVRRKSDQVITAELRNFSAQNVVLHAKYNGSLRWEQTPMQPEQNGNGYQFLFAGLSSGVEYYVEAGPSRSKHYHLGVKDLPAVKRVRTVIHFPEKLQLRDVSDDSGGDVRAVKGSEARISVLTDRPLQHGELVLNDGSKIALHPENGNWSAAVLPVQKDGSYHVAAIDSGEAVRISDDYFVEAKKDEPPVVKIVSPGRDPHVSPIEEVPVTVEASDDYGVNGLDLHYSVNGGPEKVVSLTKKKDVKQVDGKSTLYLENFKLVPGDLVSLYATARDANSTSRSDIVFAQAEPFDYHFRQLQQAGGGGMQGAGGDNDRISERQKEIIAATWNQVKNGPVAKNTTMENAHFLSQLEGKLGEQAKTLSERMGSRELVAESPEFKGFSEAMNQASQEMKNSVGSLKSAKWQDALPPEQRALQSLLRAEAMFRNIQIAFGRNASQGMGSSGAERDLSRMLDLELDKNKNQYETGNSASPSANGQQQKSLDEALQRLKMLAQRQQELAAQRQPDQLAQQRWKEEQLRREAEQLRQQMEQLSRNSNNGSQQQQQQGQSSSQAQAGGANSNSMRQAADALKRAEDEMRQAVSKQDPSARRRAAEQLSEAASLLKDRARAQAGNSVAELAQRGQQIAREQQEIDRQARRMYGSPFTPGDSSGERSADDASNDSDGSMPAMRDPRFGVRSWYWRQLEMQPRRPATAQEKALANNKEKLSGELEALQRQMQQQAQDLQSQQPGVSSKLRKALSDAEGEELALRMKKGAEWMRDGFGSRTFGMEGSVTKGVERLSRDLNSAQQAASAEGNKNSAGDQKTLEALMQVRKLRQQLSEQAQRLQSSRQPGGNQQASTQQNAANAQQNGTQPNGTQPNAAGLRGPAIPYSSIQEAANALSSLRQQLPAGERNLSRQLSGTVGYLRHLDDSRAGEMEARLSRELLPNLERLEAELNRKLEGASDSARTTAAEPAPEQYRDAVAKYFRKLSQ